MIHDNITYFTRIKFKNSYLFEYEHHKNMFKTFLLFFHTGSVKLKGEKGISGCRLILLYLFTPRRIE